MAARRHARTEIATGFHRCATVTVVPGPTRRRTAVNQVSTASTLRGRSARHDSGVRPVPQSPYDPVTQHEYYRCSRSSTTPRRDEIPTPKDTAAIEFTVHGPTLDCRTRTRERRLKAQRDLDEMYKQFVPTRRPWKGPRWPARTRTGRRTSPPPRAPETAALPKLTTSHTKQVENYCVGA